MKHKEILYHRFSINLQNISNILGFKLEKRFEKEAYICPLSFKIHTKEGLSSQYSDQLTVEHIPPKSLKGKGLCLTNRNDNSISGHSLDVALQNHINLKEFNEGIAPLDTKIYVEDVRMDGVLDFTKKSEPLIQFLYKKRHQGNERVINHVLSQSKFNVKFSIPKDNRKTLISLLRTAYLFAFGHIGYALIFGASKLVNPNFELIRRQIQNPEEILIDDIIVINKDLDNRKVGVHIIYEPKELRSLFVVFNVITQERNWKYGVFLPGPDDYGFKAIQNIRLLLKKNNTINFKSCLVTCLDITDPNDSELYYNLWIEKNGSFHE